MKVASLILLALLADPPAPPAVSQAEVAALIGQLGDASSRVRSAAAEKLKQLGKPALPLLKDAVNDPDPEIRTQAAALVRRLERKPIPGGPITFGGQLRNLRAHSRPGFRTLELEQDGRSIRILHSGEAIEIAITGDVDGKPHTETFKAASADELKKNDPEVYEIYERFAGDGQGGWILRGLEGDGNIAVLQGGGFEIVQQDPLGQLADDLRAQMRRANVDEQRQRQVIDRIAELRRLRAANPFEEFAERDRNLKEFFKKSDELRKELTDLKLPDPGDALPPPSKAALGIQFTRVEAADRDLVVIDRVVADSRAEKMGLRRGDVIRKIGQKPIKAQGDVRPAIMENKGLFEIEIERLGEVLTLKEPEEKKE